MSTFLLSSAQGNSSACLKMDISLLPHVPGQLLAEKSKDLVLLSASTLRQDAPEGLGSEELPNHKTKQMFCLLLFTGNPCEQKPPEEDLGSLCQDQNKWGAALRINNIIRASLLSPPDPKAQPVV